MSPLDFGLPYSETNLSILETKSGTVDTSCGHVHEKTKL
jgi:hypothetical protein